MTNRPRKWYGYECFTGCGHISITDKYYKHRHMYCAVCGTRSTMEYVGEFEAQQIHRPKIDLGLTLKKDTK